MCFYTSQPQKPKFLNHFATIPKMKPREIKTCQEMSSNGPTEIPGSSMFAACLPSMELTLWLF
jgi:hypothetical protein